MRRLALLLLFVVLQFAPLRVAGQERQAWMPPTSTDGSAQIQPPRTYNVLGVNVAGVEEATMRDFVRQSSGLEAGMTVTVPGGPAVADAVRSVYELGMFEDVEVIVDRVVGQGAYLTVRVQPVPRLADYRFTGIKKGHADDLRKQLPLIRRSPLSRDQVEHSKQIIRDFYREEGYPLASVSVVEKEVEEGVELVFAVDRGDKAELEDIIIHGNEAISDFWLRREMELKENRWWRFWKGESFDANTYEDDLDKLIAYYRSKGFYDARIVEDSVYLRTEGSDPGMVVELTVHEGAEYHIRDVQWRGNTVFTDQTLSSTLGVQQGDRYNSEMLEKNLYGSQEGTDVSGLYMNRGYMRVDLQPEIEVVGEDSLDVTIQVYEGDTYEFGTIEIAGNTKTKEHVIRRELYTVPGQTFSRDAIQESIRRLAQLKYFDQEELMTGPAVNMNEQAKTVDLKYDLTEVGSDQLEVSGTYAGQSIGLVFQLRFAFNNFSAQNILNPGAWRPLPAGDGQQLSLSAQANGTSYQNYSIGFTEPWFRGRPTPIGFNASYLRANYSSQDVSIATLRGFFNQRLNWPDDKFTTGTALTFRHYNVGRPLSGIPSGVSNELTLRQSLSRNSLDNPRFPSRGSNVSVAVEVAPPIGDFIQYHKWSFDSDWYFPLGHKLSVGMGTRYGYIGSLTGDDVDYQRYVVGGGPLDAQGYNSYFGRDVVYLRGYPAGAVGPKTVSGNDTFNPGGRILNKYWSELRWLAVQTPQFQAMPYVFLDAANSWRGTDSFNPAQLYRSAGVGSRVFLPMLGMIELSYGYNFDRFEPVARGSNRSGAPQWYFQFSIGQSFN